MASLKKYFPTLILSVLVYLSYFFFHLPSQHPATKDVLGAASNVILYEEPDNGRQPLLDRIDSAKKEILLEIYLLSDKQIISALEDAKSRGVDVKVMLEQHPFGGDSLNQKTKKQLDAANIETQWTNASFTLTHEKAIVIDAQETCILSQNLTASSFTKNREYDVCDTDTADAEEVRTIFIADWERKPFSPPAESNLIDSPDDSRAALTTLMQTTQKTLDIETEDINDKSIVTILSEKAKTATVRLIAPTISQVSTNENALRQLASAGVQVKTISSPYMHAKMILSDIRKAYTGSINLSTQSLDANRELGIILTQPDILQTLSTSFETDWNNSSAL